MARLIKYSPTSNGTMVPDRYGNWYFVEEVAAIFCIDDFYKVSDVEQLKAEICSTCGYSPCVNRKQFEGTIITHCTQYYKLSAV